MHYLTISQLNDFIFCPYSIYLKNVYRGAIDQVCYATPQTKGKAAHKNIDAQKYSSSKNILSGIDVYSEELNITGKIDIYDGEKYKLIERKRKIDKIYQGQLYQLYAQYFCITEMGCIVKKLAFHSLVDNKTFPVALPTQKDKEQLKSFIQKVLNYNPNTPIDTNPNKCKHCIYSNLCDQADSHANVYE